MQEHTVVSNREGGGSVQCVSRRQSPLHGERVAETAVASNQRYRQRHVSRKRLRGRGTSLLKGNAKAVARRYSYAAERRARALHVHASTVRMEEGTRAEGMVSNSMKAKNLACASNAKGRGVGKVVCRGAVVPTAPCRLVGGAWGRGGGGGGVVLVFIEYNIVTRSAPLPRVIHHLPTHIACVLNEQGHAQHTTGTPPGPSPLLLILHVVTHHMAVRHTTVFVAEHHPRHCHGMAAS